MNTSLTHYKLLLAYVASGLAKKSGFYFTGDDIYSATEPTNDNYHPLAKLCLEEARLALRMIDGYLTSQSICFKDLEVQENQKNFLHSPFGVFPTDDRGFVVECMGYTLAEDVSEFPTLSTIRMWARDLAKSLNSGEPDLGYALGCYKNHDQLVDFYDYLVTQKGLRPHDSLWYYMETTTSSNATTAKLLTAIIEMLESEKNPQNKPVIAKPSEWAKCLTICEPKPDKPKVTLSKNNELVETQNQTITTELYFDSNNICLGWRSALWHNKSYSGMYAWSRRGTLPKSLNPLGKPAGELSKHSKSFDLGFLSPDKSPKYVGSRSLTKGERELMNCFIGREIEFERFLTIKKELAAINIRVGMLISSQSTIKAWNVTGGNNRQDKAALFWTVSDGWEINCRYEQEELTGVFEDWDLIQYLEDNNVEVNGISPNDWHNARDEEAEAEVIQRQEENKTKNSSKTTILGIPCHSFTDA